MIAVGVLGTRVPRLAPTQEGPHTPPQLHCDIGNGSSLAWAPSFKGWCCLWWLWGTCFCGGSRRGQGAAVRRRCWRYALEAIMYDDISYVFMNKDSPWTLSMMCISKYVTCLWDYALYDDCPKRSLVERAVWTRSRLD